MGMSYAELGDLGKCRKVEHCGPMSAFTKLRHTWRGKSLTPSKRKRKDEQPVSHDEQVVPPLRPRHANDKPTTSPQLLRALHLRCGVARVAHIS